MLLNKWTNTLINLLSITSYYVNFLLFTPLVLTMLWGRFLALKLTGFARSDHKALLCLAVVLYIYSLASLCSVCDVSQTEVHR